MAEAKTILFVLAGSLGVKNFLYSSFAEQKFAQNNIRVVFVLENSLEHKKQMKTDNNTILEELNVDKEKLSERLKNKIVDTIYKTLNYRFSTINNLTHFLVRENIPKNYITDKEDEAKLGLWMKFPMPNSKMLYKIFYALYNSSFFARGHAKLLMDKYSPTIVMFTNAQIPLVRDYYIEARKRNIKIIGCVNNWDNLTIRGPVFEHIDKFVVWNKQMEDDLRRIHKTKKPISRIGIPHIDYSFSPSYVWDKHTMCESLGISADKKIIVFGAYNNRLGKHEPSIAVYIAKNVLAKYNAELVIRGYPSDETFFNRYKHLKNLRGVILTKGHNFSKPQTAGYDDRIILNSLMKNADLLISTGSTLDLEALRFDKPVIDLGFDGDLQLPPGASILSRYNMHHHINFFRYNSTYFVKSYAELDDAIEKAFQRPEALAYNIRKMRHQYLEPLDGKASERLFELIKSWI